MSSSAILTWGGAILLLGGEALALAKLRQVTRAQVNSSVAELGYVLLGLGLHTAAGETGAVMHLGYQVVMRSLLFLALIPLVRAAGSSRLEDMAGTGQTNRLASLLFGFAMFSVMGLSPFKGSFAKFLVLYGAIEQGEWALAAAGTLASVITLFVSITIIQRICFEKLPEGGQPAKTVTLGALTVPMLTLAAVTIVMSLVPQPFEHVAQQVAGVVAQNGLPDYESPWTLLVLVPYVGGFALYGVGHVSPRLLSAAIRRPTGIISSCSWPSGRCLAWPPTSSSEISTSSGN
jgi:NADH:ubiquinone oxidoreductase subunit 2 (subunit N)